MTKKITFLGIETSCDETAAAVIRENDKGTADGLSNIVSSQISEHKKFGGVVPELAARAHLENIEYIIETALKERKNDEYIMIPPKSGTPPTVKTPQQMGEAVSQQPVTVVINIDGREFVKQTVMPALNKEFKLQGIG